MSGLVASAVAAGSLGLEGRLAAAGREIGIGAGWHHVARLLPIGSVGPHSGAGLLGLLALLALWTAVEVPAEPVRLPLRHTFVTLVGWIALLAPLFVAAVAVGAASRGLVSVGWAAAGELVGFFALSGVATVFGFRLLVRCGMFERAILVLGVSPGWAEMGVRLDPGRGPRFKVAGVFPAQEQRGLAIDMLRRGKVWGVVAADGIAGGGSELERRCRGAGVRLLGEAEFRERWLQRVDLERVRPGMIAARREAAERGERLLGRRGADIALSVLLLFISLPVSLLTALLIKLDSPGSVFYQQERVGLNGKTFRLLKFRSMRRDAELGIGPRWAVPADSRVTRVGRYLRLARIDELPQLWNVLRGEMSLIGPRPERPYFVEQLKAVIPCYADRAAVKPGITGWAQVNYRYGASPEDARIKLAYDLYYVKHRGALLDLRILLATVRVVLFQEGAR